MTIAFALGNGRSRLRIQNLSALKAYGPVCACNAIYQEFEPEVLISTDPPISRVIQESGYSQSHTHYTRKPIPGLGAKKIDKRWHGWSSGPTAAAYASQLGGRVYLIGFDLGATPSGLFNNVYADTEFYKRSSDRPTYTGNWVRQFCSVFESFPDNRYIRVMDEFSSDIAEFKNIRNFGIMSMDEFLDRLNTTKDL